MVHDLTVPVSPAILEPQPVQLLQCRQPQRAHLQPPRAVQHRPHQPLCAGGQLQCSRQQAGGPGLQRHILQLTGEAPAVGVKLVALGFSCMSFNSQVSHCMGARRSLPLLVGALFYLPPLAYYLPCAPASLQAGSQTFMYNWVWSNPPDSPYSDCSLDNR